MTERPHLPPRAVGGTAHHSAAVEQKTSHPAKKRKATGGKRHTPRCITSKLHIAQMGLPSERSQEAKQRYNGAVHKIGLHYESYISTRQEETNHVRLSKDAWHKPYQDATWVGLCCTMQCSQRALNQPEDKINSIELHKHAWYDRRAGC